MRSLTALVTIAAAAGCGGKPGTTATTAATGAAAGVTATIEPLERTVPATEDTPEAHMRLPRVTVPGNPAASAAINAALGAPATADQIEGTGDVGLDFEVALNADGLLDVTLIHETLGAYPDSYFQHFLFDLTTGARLGGADLFRAEAMAELAALIDGKLQAALAAARTERSDCVSDDEDPFQGAYTEAHLADVGLSARGVEFRYDYDFPHAIQACEPADEFVLPLAEVRPYLRADGPLARHAK